MIDQYIKINIKIIALVTLFLAFGVISGINLSIALFLSFLFFYVKLRNLDTRNCNLLNLSLLFLIAFTASYFILKQRIAIYYIPFSIVPMLATLLFGSLEITLIIVLAISVSIASVSNFPLPVMLLFLISGVLASILVKDARKRNTIILEIKPLRKSTRYLSGWPIQKRSIRIRVTT